MKEFNLEKALAGEPLVTRDGREATHFTVFDADITYPCTFIVDEGIITCDKSGRYLNRAISQRDLFMKPKTVTKWVNLYILSGDPGTTFALFDTEEEADAEYYANQKLNRRLGDKAHKIEWEE